MHTSRESSLITTPLADTLHKPITAAARLRSKHIPFMRSCCLRPATLVPAMPRAEAFLHAVSTDTPANTIAYPA